MYGQPGEVTVSETFLKGKDSGLWDKNWRSKEGCVLWKKMADIKGVSLVIIIKGVSLVIIIIKGVPLVIIIKGVLLRVYH